MNAIESRKGRGAGGVVAGRSLSVRALMAPPAGGGQPLCDWGARR